MCALIDCISVQGIHSLLRIESKVYFVGQADLVLAVLWGVNLNYRSRAVAKDNILGYAFSKRVLPQSDELF